jgi:hypothetical protein
VHERVDEREVGEGLREVAELPSGVRVDFRRVQQERAGEQLLTQRAGTADLADLGQGRDKPE